ncbi:MAG: carbohydrate ABC transporter permease, partial [Planctomycetota bacterium]
FGILQNGWLWQGWLYACGGESLHMLKTCPECAKETRFPQGELHWKCSGCAKVLREVHGRERASLDSPEAARALGLWQTMLWAPFCKCPSCGEPVELGDARTKVRLPHEGRCPGCKKSFTLTSEDDVIKGCARPCAGDGGTWDELWLNGEIAIFNFHLTDWIAESNVDPAVVGVMPYPERGGASAFHYYGIYAGSRDRPGGTERVKLCADMILDFVSQFYVPRDHPDYLKYEKERARKHVDDGFYNLSPYDELVAAGLEEYANEIPPASREMQRLIRDPGHYKFLPMSEGYSRVQQEILTYVLLSRICTDRDYDVEANLAKANELANTQVFMKDEIVREMMSRYRLVFAGVLILLIGGAGLLIYKYLVKGRGTASTAVRLRRITLGKRAASVMLLVPAVFLILVWAYYPLVRGSVMAFQDVKVLGESRFVGMENFIRVVTSPLFWSVINSTVIYVIATLSLGFLAPVFLAILLSEARRGSTAYRAVYYAPHLLGGVVVLFIWRLFFMPTDEGLLNHLIGGLGLGPVRWLEDPAINKWMLAIPGIWAGTGSACLIYLAALKSIDGEMYEAAEIDGAGTFGKIFHITLPSLKPLLIINFVGAFIGAFHGMGNILVLTGGAFETNVIGLQIFLEAFGYLRFGSATALAWVLGSMLIGFTVYQLSFLRKVEFRRAQ